jgi:hypothetical protein
MKALPAMFYRDPADCVDELRRLRKPRSRPTVVVYEQAMPQVDRSTVKAELLRLHKSRRIRALVRVVMNRGGGRHGK